MHAVLFYLLATAALTITSSVGFYYVNVYFGRKNVFFSD